MVLVAGVDSSTQATKVLVVRAESGEIVARGRAPHPATTPPVSEQDPLSWWDALVAAWSETGADGRRVAAVSVAAQQHGLVVADGDGAPLRPAKLWNDTTSAGDAAALVEELGGPRAWADACGSVPVASFTITKLRWLVRHEPEVAARVGHVFLPHDWLTWRLTGRRVTDRGDASGTGWWSPATGDYRPELLRLVDDSVDWAERLPAVLAPLALAGTVTAAAAADLGVAPTTVVGPGTGDNMAAALGLALRPGDAAISLGTSGTVSAVSDRPTADPSGAVAGFADATGRFLPLVCTLNATKVTDAVAGLLEVGRDALAGLALAAEPGAGGLTLLPYLDGERTPNRPGATGVLAGLRTATSRQEVARAAHEGVVCGLLDGLDALAATGVGVAGRLVLTGGGARSAAYRRIVADLSGRAVLVPTHDEAVALGAALQAAAVLLGETPDDLAAAWGLGQGEVVDPSAAAGDADIRARYAELRDRTAAG